MVALISLPSEGIVTGRDPSQLAQPPGVTWDNVQDTQCRRTRATAELLASALFLAPPVLPSGVMAVTVPAAQSPGRGSYWCTREDDVQGHMGTRGC